VCVCGAAAPGSMLLLPLQHAAIVGDSTLENCTFDCLFN